MARQGPLALASNGVRINEMATTEPSRRPQFLQEESKNYASPTAFRLERSAARTCRR